MFQRQEAWAIKNPKSEGRRPKEGRNPKSEKFRRRRTTGVRSLRASANHQRLGLDCAGGRSDPLARYVHASGRCAAALARFLPPNLRRSFRCGLHGPRLDQPFISRAWRRFYRSWRQEPHWEWPTSERFAQQHERLLAAARAHGLPEKPLVDTQKEELVTAAVNDVCKLTAATAVEIAHVLPPVYELLP